MLAQANSAFIPLADKSVHCAVTSIPYWGLRSYLADDDPLKPLELGLEPSLNVYLQNMVAVFQEVKRVLRDDGTLWLNVGDSYATSVNGRSAADTKAVGGDDRTFRDKPFSTVTDGLKPKDLCGVPWRLAFALQAAGWWLRRDIIWSKPNPMPESVNDRPTTAHEYIFLLTKSERYFYDAEAVKEPIQSGPSDIRKMTEGKERIGGKNKVATDHLLMASSYTNIGRKRSVGNPGAGRNRRSVWEIATQPYPGAHFATFPTKLVEPCVLAGTSARGCCPKCGSPWVRVVERESHSLPVEQRTGRVGHNGAPPQQSGWFWQQPEIKTTGWQPACSCGCADTVPAIVLDPFAGSGTVGEVCRNLGRRFIGLDLNPSYLALNALPRAEGKTSQAALAELPMFAGLF